MRRIKTRRMGRYDSSPQLAYAGEVVISARDLRLMRRVVRLADKWACGKGYVYKLADAVIAFNAPEKRK